MHYYLLCVPGYCVNPTLSTILVCERGVCLFDRQADVVSGSAPYIMKVTSTIRYILVHIYRHVCGARAAGVTQQERGKGQSAERNRGGVFCSLLFLFHFFPRWVLLQTFNFEDREKKRPAAVPFPSPIVKPNLVPHGKHQSPSSCCWAEGARKKSHIVCYSHIPCPAGRPDEGSGFATEPP